jgi:hypothetical protein
MLRYLEAPDTAFDTRALNIVLTTNPATINYNFKKLKLYTIHQITMYELLTCTTLEFLWSPLATGFAKVKLKASACFNQTQGAGLSGASSILGG